MVIWTEDLEPGEPGRNGWECSSCGGDNAILRVIIGHHICGSVARLELLACPGCIDDIAEEFEIAACKCRGHSVS